MANLCMDAKRVKAPKKMYQHTIPRFILRQFDVSYEPLPSHTDEDQNLWKPSRRYPTIHFYNLANTQLTIEDLGSVYGETNLYRNQNEPRDIDYLEHRLGSLEQSACSAIKSIHYGIPSSSVTFTRADLASLRKFVFLTHYRSAAASVTYFCKTDPRNSPLVDWIENLKISHGLETEVDVWKEGLKYYLDTPHEQIVGAGEALRKRYGEQQVHKMLQNRVDPELEEWYAIDYENQVKHFSLGIWEAATGDEFILSENGSGIWDGLIYGSSGTHKIYVVSPRIALVLRRDRDPFEPESNLDSIPLPQAQVIRSGDLSPHPTVEKSRRPVNDGNPLHESQDDRFAFNFTRLSSEQTNSVNEVLLQNANVKHHGSITFLSRRSMLRTLECYMASGNPAVLEGKGIFLPLLTNLSASELKEANTNRDFSLSANL